MTSSVSTCLLQLGDAGLGDAHAARALELEGLGHHGHGQDAELLGHARDHRGGAGAGAAAHAGGDEHHVAAGDAPRGSPRWPPRRRPRRSRAWSRRPGLRSGWCRAGCGARRCEASSACASVLATMNSAPVSPAAIMLLTALPPAPPTPITAMRGFIIASPSKALPEPLSHTPQITRRPRSRPVPARASGRDRAPRERGRRPSKTRDRRNPAGMPASGSTRATRTGRAKKSAANSPSPACWLAPPVSTMRCLA